MGKNKSEAKALDLAKEKFVRAKGVLHFRAGTRAPWFEFVVVMPSGEQKRLIAKVVEEFFSEKQKGEVL